MRLAHKKQKFQDWFTQQWAILNGSKIDPKKDAWLMGPFGDVDGIGINYLKQLAKKENLIINRDTESSGLIASLESLNLPETDLSALSPEVIRFYEKTADYILDFKVKWNPFFKFFGILVNKLFSNRINQLNIPIKNTEDTGSILSEIITLSDPATETVRYTIWLRTVRTSGRVIYSGVYGLSEIPSGKTCVKAVFPLPNGNATVIMYPTVGLGGELILTSSGKNFGDAGFYFLLNDSRGNYWAQFIRSFRDTLIVRSENGHVVARQIMTLWNLKVLELNYRIKAKSAFDCDSLFFR